MGTLYRQTTSIKKRVSGSWQDVALIGGVKRFTGGVWVTANAVARRTSGGWTLVLSSPDVNTSGGGGSTGSGASSSGSASVGASATPGGTRSGSDTYSWSYVSGDGVIAPNSSAIFNPTFSRNFSGVANGTTSGSASAVWRCHLFDNETGAIAYHDITIGPLAWQNTIPAFGGQTNTFPGPDSSSVTIPTGANSLTVYVIGGGGRGGSGQYIDADNHWGGGGGGGGGRAVYSTSISSGLWGGSIGFVAGGPRQSSSVSSYGLSAAPGGSDGNASGGPGGGMLGGSGSGGNVANDDGAPGLMGGTDGGGPGGAGHDGYGAGGDGGGPTFGGNEGQQGAVIFVWSP